MACLDILRYVEVPVSQMRPAILVVAFVLVTPNVACAQEPRGSPVLEEVTVTAQRRSENLLDVPIAVTVLSAEDIANSGAFELGQLGDYIPNVYIRQNSDFHARIVIRGVGAHSRNIGFDTRVGVYLDGVYLGHSPAINQNLIDLEHVEVLRGPQGTLFGKNSIAGAFVLVSQKPKAEWDFDAKANVYNYDGLELSASANVPLGESVATRVYVYDRSQDGFVTNVFDSSHVPSTINIIHPQFGPIFGLPLCDELGGSSPPGCVGGPVGPERGPPAGQDFGSEDLQAYRAQLRAELGEAWELNLTVDGLDSHRDFVFGEPLTDTFGSTIDRYAPGFLEVSISNPGIQERDIFGASAIVDYFDPDGYRFKSISAYRDTENQYVNDSDGSAFDANLGGVTNRYEQFSQEFQYISDDIGPLRYIVGLYYFKEDATTTGDGPIGRSGWLFGIAPGAATTASGTVETRSLAAYANATYDLNERWSLGLGLRYTDESKDVVYHQDASQLPALFGIGSTPPEGYIDSISDDDYSPSLYVGYTTPADVHLYARYAGGFKSPGFNVDTVSQEDLDSSLAFFKETVDSYELGLKGYFLDSRLFVSAAAFLALYDNYQVNQFFDLGFDPEAGTQTTSIRITNAAKVDTYGLELEGKYRLNDRWQLNAFLGLLEATFDDFPGGTSMDVPDPDVPGGIRRVPVNAAGNTLPEAPAVNAGLGIDFETPVGEMNTSLAAHLDVLYTGDYYTTIENEKTRTLTGTHPLTFAFDFEAYGVPHEIQYGYVQATTIVNGRIGLIDGEGRWDVYLWGRNLTDEDEYFQYARDFLGVLWASPRTPRMYGIEFSYHYR